MTIRSAPTVFRDGVFDGKAVITGGGTGIGKTIAHELCLLGCSVVLASRTGTFLVTKYAYEAYLKDHGGAIVNILVAMNKGFPYESHSGASRAAVENLTKSLAYEWASRGIRVNSVTPGTILSSGLSNYGPVADQVCTSYSAHTPARRLGTVEEVSAATVFLLSPAAAYTTGTNAIVDGGWNLAGALVPLPQHVRYPVYGTSKL
ncbi:hypothetical protein DYB36_003363 [Aphanomyces astaci]|uniref:Peroxisomal trans-2-enoyl-CoA reductase n=1 Tax=Aphanomyces astaci TaxID=112090 RepID=A0A397AGT0_APHAT|nr:hypothetical protein DYB36_003363 [Aphanomyces astaci]